MTRNAGRKKRIRERAALEGVSYREASRLDQRGSSLADGTTTTFRELAEREIASRRTASQLLAAFIDSWCADRVHMSLDELSENLRDDFELQVDFEEPTVHELVPELWTVDSQIEEEYDGGVQALNGSVQASLRIEGYMAHAQAYAAADLNDVVIVDPVFSEHYAEVLDPGEGSVELEFAALVDLERQVVETFDITGVRFLGRSR